MLKEKEKKQKFFTLLKQSEPAAIRTRQCALITSHRTATHARRALMRELFAVREVKNGGLPEAQKNATRRVMNGEMQKLLGDEICARRARAIAKPRCGRVSLAVSSRAQSAHRDDVARSACRRRSW